MKQFNLAYFSIRFLLGLMALELSFFAPAFSAAPPGSTDTATIHDNDPSRTGRTETEPQKIARIKAILASTDLTQIKNAIAEIEKELVADSKKVFNEKDAAKFDELFKKYAEAWGVKLDPADLFGTKVPANAKEVTDRVAKILKASTDHFKVLKSKNDERLARKDREERVLACDATVAANPHAKEIFGTAAESTTFAGIDGITNKVKTEPERRRFRFEVLSLVSNIMRRCTLPSQTMNRSAAALIEKAAETLLKSTDAKIKELGAEMLPLAKHVMLMGLARPEFRLIWQIQVKARTESLDPLNDKTEVPHTKVVKEMNDLFEALSKTPLAAMTPDGRNSNILIATETGMPKDLQTLLGFDPADLAKIRALSKTSLASDIFYRADEPFTADPYKTSFASANELFARMTYRENPDALSKLTLAPGSAPYAQKAAVVRDLNEALRKLDDPNLTHLGLASFTGTNPFKEPLSRETRDAFRRVIVSQLVNLDGEDIRRVPGLTDADRADHRLISSTGGTTDYRFKDHAFPAWDDLIKNPTKEKLDRVRRLWLKFEPVAITPTMSPDDRKKAEQFNKELFRAAYELVKAKALTFDDVAHLFRHYYAEKTGRDLVEVIAGAKQRQKYLEHFYGKPENREAGERYKAAFWGKANPADLTAFEKAHTFAVMPQQEKYTLMRLLAEDMLGIRDAVPKAMASEIKRIFQPRLPGVPATIYEEITKLDESELVMLQFLLDRVRPEQAIALMKRLVQTEDDKKQFPGKTQLQHMVEVIQDTYGRVDNVWAAAASRGNVAEHFEQLVASQVHRTVTSNPTLMREFPREKILEYLDTRTKEAEHVAHLYEVSGITDQNPVSQEIKRAIAVALADEIDSGNQHHVTSIATGNAWLKESPIAPLRGGIAAPGRVTTMDMEEFKKLVDNPGAMDLATLQRLQAWIDEQIKEHKAPPRRDRDALAALHTTLNKAVADDQTPGMNICYKTSMRAATQNEQINNSTPGEAKIELVVDKTKFDACVARMKQVRELLKSFENGVGTLKFEKEAVTRASIPKLIQELSDDELLEFSYAMFRAARKRPVPTEESDLFRGPQYTDGPNRLSYRKMTESGFLEERVLAAELQRRMESGRFKFRGMPFDDQFNWYWATGQMRPGENNVNKDRYHKAFFTTVFTHENLPTEENFSSPEAWWKWAEQKNIDSGTWSVVATDYLVPVDDKAESVTTETRNGLKITRDKNFGPLTYVLGPDGKKLAMRGSLGLMKSDLLSEKVGSVYHKDNMPDTVKHGIAELDRVYTETKDFPEKLKQMKPLVEAAIKNRESQLASKMPRLPAEAPKTDVDADKIVSTWTQEQKLAVVQAALIHKSGKKIAGLPVVDKKLADAAALHLRLPPHLLRMQRAFKEEIRLAEDTSVDPGVDSKRRKAFKDRAAAHLGYIDAISDSILASERVSHSVGDYDILTNYSIDNSHALARVNWNNMRYFKNDTVVRNPLWSPTVHASVQDRLATTPIDFKDPAQVRPYLLKRLTDFRAAVERKAKPGDDKAPKANSENILGNLNNNGSDPNEAELNEYEDYLWAVLHADGKLKEPLLNMELVYTAPAGKIRALIPSRLNRLRGYFLQKLGNVMDGKPVRLSVHLPELLPGDARRATLALALTNVIRNIDNQMWSPEFRGSDEVMMQTAPKLITSTDIVDYQTLLKHEIAAYEGDRDGMASRRALRSTLYPNGTPPEERIFVGNSNRNNVLHGNDSEANRLMDPANLVWPNHVSESRIRWSRLNPFLQEVLLEFAERINSKTSRGGVTLYDHEGKKIEIDDDKRDADSTIKAKRYIKSLFYQSRSEQVLQLIMKNEWLRERFAKVVAKAAWAEFSKLEKKPFASQAELETALKDISKLSLEKAELVREVVLDVLTKHAKTDPQTKKSFAHTLTGDGTSALPGIEASALILGMIDRHSHHGIDIVENQLRDSIGGNDYFRPEFAFNGLSEEFKVIAEAKKTAATKGTDGKPTAEAIRFQNQLDRYQAVLKYNHAGFSYKSDKDETVTLSSRGIASSSRLALLGAGDSDWQKLDHLIATASHMDPKDVPALRVALDETIHVFDPKKTAALAAEFAPDLAKYGQTKLTREKLFETVVEDLVNSAYGDFSQVGAQNFKALLEIELQSMVFNELIATSGTARDGSYSDAAKERADTFLKQNGEKIMKDLLQKIKNEAANRLIVAKLKELGVDVTKVGGTIMLNGRPVRHFRDLFSARYGSFDGFGKDVNDPQSLYVKLTTDPKLVALLVERDPKLRDTKQENETRSEADAYKEYVPDMIAFIEQTNPPPNVKERIMKRFGEFYGNDDKKVHAGLKALYYDPAKNWERVDPRTRTMNADQLKAEFAKKLLAVDHFTNSGKWDSILGDRLTDIVMKEHGKTNFSGFADDYQTMISLFYEAIELPKLCRSYAMVRCLQDKANCTFMTPDAKQKECSDYNKKTNDEKTEFIIARAKALKDKLPDVTDEARKQVREAMFENLVNQARIRSPNSAVTLFKAAYEGRNFELDSYDDVVRRDLALIADVNSNHKISTIIEISRRKEEQIRAIAADIQFRREMEKTYNERVAALKKQKEMAREKFELEKEFPLEVRNKVKANVEGIPRLQEEMKQLQAQIEELKPFNTATVQRTTRASTDLQLLLLAEDKAAMDGVSEEVKKLYENASDAYLLGHNLSSGPDSILPPPASHNVLKVKSDTDKRTAVMEALVAHRTALDRGRMLARALQIPGRRVPRGGLLPDEKNKNEMDLIAKWIEDTISHGGMQGIYANKDAARRRLREQFNELYRTESLRSNENADVIADLKKYFNELEIKIPGETKTRKLPTTWTGKGWNIADWDMVAYQHLLQNDATKDEFRRRLAMAGAVTGRGNSLEDIIHSIAMAKHRRSEFAPTFEFNNKTAVEASYDPVSQSVTFKYADLGSSEHTVTTDPGQADDTKKVRREYKEPGKRAELAELVQKARFCLDGQPFWLDRWKDEHGDDITVFTSWIEALRASDGKTKSERLLNFCAKELPNLVQQIRALGGVTYFDDLKREDGLRPSSMNAISLFPRPTPASDIATLLLVETWRFEMDMLIQAHENDKLDTSRYREYAIWGAIELATLPLRFEAKLGGWIGKAMRAAKASEAWIKAGMRTGRVISTTVAGVMHGFRSAARLHFMNNFIGPTMRRWNQYRLASQARDPQNSAFYDGVGAQLVGFGQGDKEFWDKYIQSKSMGPHPLSPEIDRNGNWIPDIFEQNGTFGSASVRRAESWKDLVKSMAIFGGASPLRQVLVAGGAPETLAGVLSFGGAAFMTEMWFPDDHTYTDSQRFEASLAHGIRSGAYALPFEGVLGSYQRNPGAAFIANVFAQMGIDVVGTVYEHSRKKRWDREDAERRGEVYKPQPELPNEVMNEAYDTIRQGIVMNFWFSWHGVQRGRINYAKSRIAKIGEPGHPASLEKMLEEPEMKKLKLQDHDLAQILNQLKAKEVLDLYEKLKGNPKDVEKLKKVLPDIDFAVLKRLEGMRIGSNLPGLGYSPINLPLHEAMNILKSEIKIKLAQDSRAGRPITMERYLEDTKIAGVEATRWVNMEKLKEQYDPKNPKHEEFPRLYAIHLGLIPEMPPHEFSLGKTLAGHFNIPGLAPGADGNYPKWIQWIQRQARKIPGLRPTPSGDPNVPDAYPGWMRSVNNGLRRIPIIGDYIPEIKPPGMHSEKLREKYEEMERTVHAFQIFLAGHQERNKTDAMTLKQQFESSRTDSNALAKLLIDGKMNVFHAEAAFPNTFNEAWAKVPTRRQLDILDKTTPGSQQARKVIEAQRFAEAFEKDAAIARKTAANATEQLEIDAAKKRNEDRLKTLILKHDILELNAMKLALKDLDPDIKAHNDFLLVWAAKKGVPHDYLVKMIKSLPKDNKHTMAELMIHAQTVANIAGHAGVSFGVAEIAYPELVLRRINANTPNPKDRKDKLTLTDLANLSEIVDPRIVAPEILAQGGKILREEYVKNANDAATRGRAKEILDMMLINPYFVRGPGAVDVPISGLDLGMPSNSGMAAARIPGSSDLSGIAEHRSFVIRTAQALGVENPQGFMKWLQGRGKVGQPMGETIPEAIVRSGMKVKSN